MRLTDSPIERRARQWFRSIDWNDYRDLGGEIVCGLAAEACAYDLSIFEDDFEIPEWLFEIAVQEATRFKRREAVA